jgi:hypothetical protein
VTDDWAWAAVANIASAAILLSFNFEFIFVSSGFGGRRTDPGGFSG